MTKDLRSLVKEMEQVKDIQKLQFLKYVGWERFTPKQLEILRKAEGSGEEALNIDNWAVWKKATIVLSDACIDLLNYYYNTENDIKFLRTALKTMQKKLETARLNLNRQLIEEGHDDLLIVDKKSSRK